MRQHSMIPPLPYFPWCWIPGLSGGIPPIERAFHRTFDCWFAAGGSKSIKIIAFASEPLVEVYLPKLPKQQLVATKI